MNVLVACEYSGVVRDAFRKRGHSAWSCDLLEAETSPHLHVKGDALEAIRRGRPTDGEKWDMVIAHPPCTYLTVSGNKWLKDQPERKSGVLVGEKRRLARIEAIKFVESFWNCGIEKIAIENPIGVLSSMFRKPDQVIQPWMFGHGETKATCLWLRGLPLLQPTHRNDDLFCLPEPKERIQRLHLLPPSPDRWKERSRTYQGIADAMAEQWG